MSSTWRSVVLALAISLALAAIILFVILRWVLPGEGPFSRVQEPEYVIGDWQGQVAVFQGTQTYPMQVLEVYTGALPATQRQQVLDGVPVHDGERLWQVLEDYTG